MVAYFFQLSYCTAFVTMEFLRLNLSNFKIDHRHKYIGISFGEYFLTSSEAAHVVSLFPSVRLMSSGQKSGLS